MGRAADALHILNRDDLHEEWRASLERLIHKGVHSLIAGWSVRLLLDAGAIPPEELYRLARLALSPVNPPSQCAAWATGLLRGSGMALLHQDALWRVFDRWLTELSGPVFVEMLPLLRRAFADFTGPERRQMGEKVKHLGSPLAARPALTDVADESARIDAERASRVLPILAHILGSQ